MAGGRLSATGKSRRLETIFPGWPDTCDEHMRRVRTYAIHTALNQFARGRSYVNVRLTDTSLLSTAGAMSEDDEGTDDEGPIEVFGIHRLELKPGSKSGYVGVRPNPSKKRPWQAWLQDGGRRKTVGNYKHRQEAAVARAVAKAEGAHLLRSPRKQAARNSGAVPRPNPHRITSLCPYPPSIMISQPLA